VVLKLLRSVHLSTQNLLHHIDFGAVLLRMLSLKDPSIIIIKVTYIVSLKCKIIFNITSTYITSVIYGNVGFLAGTITLEVAYSITMVALNIGGVTGGYGCNPRIANSFHQIRAKSLNSLVACLTRCCSRTRWELNFCSTLISQSK
jgi:hypothetical protein